MEDYLPNEIKETSLLSKQSRQVLLNNGYQVNVNPLVDQEYALPQNQKYAVIVDTSYSMKDHQAEIKDTLSWWQSNLVSNGNNLDLYVTNSKGDQARSYSEIKDWNVDRELFFGTLQTEDMLRQYDKLKGNSSYDAILLITDEGSYELSEDKQKIPAIGSPLWMIHLGGEYPRAYNDVVLQAIQKSRGGVAESLPTVMKRLATENKNQNSSVIDGYSWQVTQSTGDQSPDNLAGDNNAINAIESISARQLVYYLSGQGDQELSLQQLDNIHNVAKTYDIVTPYSSMIVLVNDQQREELRKAEEREDRFDREVEKGFEDLDQPFNPLESSGSDISGVPEPDFWMLLIVVMLGLSLVVYRQRHLV